MLRTHTIPVGFAVLAAALMATTAVACKKSSSGGGSSSPTSPSSTGPATITISATGVTPTQVRIGIGGRVQFVNNSGRTREIRSGPHPTHTGCPPINGVPTLANGQNGQTDAFDREASCSFHDNLDDTNEAFQGTILVGESAAPPPDPY